MKMLSHWKHFICYNTSRLRGWNALPVTSHFEWFIMSYIQTSRGDNMQCNIYSLRTKKGWSLRKLSKLCGVSYSYLNKLENNNGKKPSISVCRKIAKALGVSIYDVFNFEEADEEMIIKLMKIKKAKTLNPQELVVGYSHLNSEKKYYVSRIILREIKKKE